MKTWIEKMMVEDYSAEPRAKEPGIGLARFLIPRLGGLLIALLAYGLFGRLLYFWGQGLL